MTTKAKLTNRGNRNAAKPDAKRRVPISARVLPETAAALRADKRGVGRAIDSRGEAGDQRATIRLQSLFDEVVGLLLEGEGLLLVFHRPPPDASHLGKKTPTEVCRRFPKKPTHFRGSARGTVGLLG